ncbi:MAG: PEGA domain-containing protein [Deltaproteobacteria bacterium]|nr:PEGA domain-containing protein [Deltaproteobacteria bacterium]MDQ3295538.1 PEGA domain-containing protein [Myxococcota bacterium]
MRALVFAALVLLGLFGSPARADDREDARKEFAAGQAADRRRAWQEAIEHYMRANDLVPHPFAMFNIATDYERLGKLREAANWYERYLDTSSTTEADREKVHRILIELRNRPAQVTVGSTPDGARVVINGIPSGSTPYTGQLKGGMYRIAVEKGRARDWKEVTIEFGEPAVVQFHLPGAGPSHTPQPHVDVPRPAAGTPSGTMRVTGEPVGAMVTIDGMGAGTMPLDVPLAPGSYTVAVTAFGYAPYQTTAVVLPNQETVIEARPTRALGHLAPGPVMPVGYLLGGGGGADVRGSGALYLVEAGIRVFQYDASARVGRVFDVTAVDLLIRYTMGKARFAPYIGAGYSYVSQGFGFVFLGGLRWDISRGDKLGMSLMLESGYRYYTGTAVDDGPVGDTVAASGSVVPLMASLLIVYR